MFTGPVAAAPTSASLPYFVPSLLPGLPAAGEQVQVRLTATHAATGVVVEVDPSPLGGLVTVDVRAADRSTGEPGRVRLAVPGWAIQRD